MVILFLVLSGFATGATWLCYYKALQVGEVSKVELVNIFLLQQSAAEEIFR